MTYLLLLLMSLFHPSQRDHFIAEKLAELKHAAAEVGDYQHNPPALTSSTDDAQYVVRAETDISIALSMLKKYKHHHAAEQDVESAMSQLSSDLEDIPPAHFAQDLTNKI